MKRVVKLLSVVLTLLFLTGCIQVKTIIKVKPDGSGTVDETFLINKSFIMRQETAKRFGAIIAAKTQEPPKKQPEKKADIFDETKLKEKAETMGEGVTYLSGKKLITKGAEGYQVTYSFTDINNLKISQNPSERTPVNSSVSFLKIRFPEELTTFQFTKGPPAILTVKQPSTEPNDKPQTSVEEPTATDKPESKNDDINNLVTSMFQEHFEDMKAEMAIEVEGTIIETNATYQEGSKIILMDIDFNELAENQEKFKEFSKVGFGSFGEVKKFMKDSPGPKVDLNEEMIIKFE